MDIGTFYKQKIYPNLYAIEQKMTRIPYHHFASVYADKIGRRRGRDSF